MKCLVYGVACFLVLDLALSFSDSALPGGSEKPSELAVSIPPEVITVTPSNGSVTSDPPPHTTTSVPTTLSTTPPTTSTTKPTTTPAPTPTSSTTSTKPPTTTSVAPSTNHTTLSPSTTTHKPEPQPGRKFDLPSFIGGFVLAAGLMAIGVVSWKFYLSRQENFYHTL